MVGALFEASGETVRAAIEAGSPQNACALVQAGAGIALVDEFSACSWASSKFVVRPVLNSPVLKATLVRLRTEPMSQLAQGFVDVLQGVMAREGFRVSTHKP
jgi:DNA-binding transcriptional LysR family regulator